MSLSSWLPGAVLGGGALLASLPSTINQFRDRGRSVSKQEGEIEKQEGEVRLTEEERKKVAAEAASINTNDLIKVGELWQEQFNAVREELTTEQRLSRRLKKWADEHQKWDQRAWALALETDPLYPPPPQLEHDD